jgi:hypothetical protein
VCWSCCLKGEYERLLKLKPDIEAALAAKPNEADTRLKVLDRFLFEVLEWNHAAVFTEPPTASATSITF